ncbi:dihydroxy-acid dehydratase [Amycolatopsis jejuensis]|uniref:dihydroxy-acid dehydratase n=1 Tax=Amycolatopsis jejuensis TaxID=330084 RepID=UPI000526C117|nr:dihydroxy-acid dehydratase [Amycolatopsis jejuensis]
MTGADDRGLRSENWTKMPGINGFLQRAALKSQGLRERDYAKPVVGICTNTSDFTRCHTHFDGMVDAVKQTVLESGGLPRVFNSMVMGADTARPIGISFLHRNLLAMEIEQIAATYAMDGLVLLGACDETIPAMLMAAASLDLPALVVPGGPSFTGYWRGRDVGSGADMHEAFDSLERGDLDECAIRHLESSLERTAGHCTTMGTAATMTTIAEALGMAPAGSSAIPAVDSRRLAMCRDAGEHIMRLIADDVRPSQIMTAQALDNGIRALATVDGSSNAVIHLLALAGRLGLDLRLERFDELSRDTPVLLNLRPSGDYYLNDFFNAGGVPALLNALSPLLHRDALTVTGRTLGEEIESAVIEDPRVIGTIAEPIAPPRGFAVVRGNIAPDGAIIRTGVATPELLVHRGRAVVFESNAELQATLYHPDFDIRPGDVVVLRGQGPRGAVGMPEYGRIPVPAKLLAQGITDLLRVSDNRMGGTVHATAVLHVAPESAVGGPLGLVRTGDVISLDITERRIDVELSDAELDARRASQVVSPSLPERGFARLYATTVTQTNSGCDLDFLCRARHTIHDVDRACDAG